MSTYKNNTAVLFQNSPGEKGNRPVLKGRCTIKGVDFELAFWVATDRDTGEPRLDNDGKKWFTGKVSVKDDPKAPPTDDEIAW